MDKVKVCAYCRVSTDKLDQLNSFENQKYYFDKYIANNKEYELINIYADEGISGTSLRKRDQFLQMLYDAGLDIEVSEVAGDKRSHKTEYLPRLSDREPKFKYIMVKNTSRFARNILVLDIVRKLKQKGVYIHFLDINKTTENEADVFLLELLMLLDGQESRDKSAKVKWGHQISAEQGKIFTNDRIYGFKYIKKTNSLEIVPEEAEVVKMMFDLYAEGFGVRRILNIFKDKGIKTRAGKDFSITTIKKMLENEKYYGCNVRNKYSCGVVFDAVRSPQLKDKSEWIYHEGVIPPIVSKELFEKCQKLRQSKVSVKNQKGIYKGVSKYSGIIFCEKCQNTFIRNTDKGRGFYMCSKKKREGVKGCDNINISEKFLFTVIEGLRRNLYHDLDDDRGGYIDEMTTLIEKLLENINKDNDLIIEEKNKQLVALENKNDRLLDIFLDNEIEKDVFSQRKEIIDAEIESIKLEVAELSKTNTEIMNDVMEVAKVIEELEALEIKEEYTEEEIFEQVYRIEINRSHKNYKEPMFTYHYKMIDKMNELTEKYSERLCKLEYGDMEFQYEEEDDLENL